MKPDQHKFGCFTCEKLGRDCDGYNIKKSLEHDIKQSNKFIANTFNKSPCHQNQFDSPGDKMLGGSETADLYLDTLLIIRQNSLSTR